ncbi:hypothetical protein GEMRC1_013003 [Eukaryota sp. GEM-RC1]
MLFSGGSSASKVQKLSLWWNGYKDGWCRQFNFSNLSHLRFEDFTGDFSSFLNCLKFQNLVSLRLINSDIEGVLSCDVFHNLKSLEINSDCTSYHLNHLSSLEELILNHYPDLMRDFDHEVDLRLPPSLKVIVCHEVFLYSLFSFYSDSLEFPIIQCPSLCLKILFPKLLRSFVLKEYVEFFEHFLYLISELENLSYLDVVVSYIEFLESIELSPPFDSYSKEITTLYT